MGSEPGCVPLKDPAWVPVDDDAGCRWEWAARLVVVVSCVGVFVFLEPERPDLSGGSSGWSLDGLAEKKLPSVFEKDALRAADPPLPPRPVTASPGWVGITGSTGEKASASAAAAGC
jgi:hypothetical protein